MSEINSSAAYSGALNILPYAMREVFLKIPEDKKASAEEIRLRIGQIPTILDSGGESAAGEEFVTQRDLECVLELASRVSMHAVADSISRGFITAPGGYRVGFCGTVSMSGGKITGFRRISSAVIRIPREILGAADDIMGRAFSGGRPRSVLIVSPPGGGKTTLLRDMIRSLSCSGLRVAVSDERGEIAAMSAGIPQMDLGPRADVLDACPKSRGVMALLRCMNPQIIAVDEITSPEDTSALVSASNCGVKLLATAHGDSLSDIESRPVYKKLLEARIFDGAVFITVVEGKRKYEYTELKGET